MTDFASIDDSTSCRDCPFACRPYVPGMGATPCSLMVVGTAPSETEERTGLPFEGKTGELIKEIIGGLGLGDRTYYTNLVPRRPVGSDGKNRRPTAGEVVRCSRHLDKEIQQLKPDLILAVGSTPLNYLAGQKIPSIKLVHGLILRVERFGMMLSILPVHDPAYIARVGGLLSSEGQEWVSDLEGIRERLEAGVG